MDGCQQRMHQIAETAPHAAGMGTTLTCGYVVWPRLYLAHVGDSRAYLLRGQRLDLSRVGAAALRPRSQAGVWRGSDLTGRELEVLSLLVEGCTGPTIASRLGISRNTVRTHIQSILTKLQVHSRLQAAAFAVDKGLVDVSSPGAIDARRAAGER